MKSVTLLAFAAILIFGCKQSSQTAQPETQTTETSIRTAIQAHLAHKGTLNLQSFDTDVKQVTIQGDHATAEVEFRVKNGAGAMQLTYALEKRDGAWSVTESDPVGSNFTHPGLDPGQSAPNAVPDPGAGHSLADTLRAFKPGVPATR